MHLTLTVYVTTTVTLTGAAHDFSNAIPTKVPSQTNLRSARAGVSVESRMSVIVGALRGGRFGDAVAHCAGVTRHAGVVRVVAGELDDLSAARDAERRGEQRRAQNFCEGHHFTPLLRGDGGGSSESWGKMRRSRRSTHGVRGDRVRHLALEGDGTPLTDAHPAARDDAEPGAAAVDGFSAARAQR